MSFLTKHKTCEQKAQGDLARVRSHFGSSCYSAQGDVQAVSDLMFTSPHFGRIPSFCASFSFLASFHVSSVLRNSSLSRHPFLLVSHKATQSMLKSQKTSFDVTFDVRPSPISSTSSLHSGGSDVAMCPPAVVATNSVVILAQVTIWRKW